MERSTDIEEQWLVSHNQQNWSHMRARWSDFFVLHGEDVLMSPDVFGGISNGSKECLDKLKSDATSSMACLKSNRGDSVLHLAATWGHSHLVEEIVPKYHSLLLKPNSAGQTPLHVAAHGGHTKIVEVFIHVVDLPGRSNEEIERLNPYVLKDEDGNTALHLAIEGSFLETAARLVSAYKDASFLGNNKGKSSLYMAVRTGNVSLVKSILETTCNEDRESNLFSKLQGRKNLAHVALKAKSKGVFDVIRDKYPSLMNERDKEGRTCLSFAIFIEHHDGVSTILEKSSKSVYVCNADGSFPIHTAAEKGDSSTVRKILRRCPDSKYLLNKYGQNILHIATKNGMHRFVRHLMTYKETKHVGELTVGQDVDGNTPLHLAVINWHSKCITLLANNNKVLKIQNKNGLKARDIAESELKPNYIFKERFTLALILYATHSKNVKHVHSLTRESEPTDPKNTRDYVNTLLLVATLVATVTFAAGFTIPGGFNSSGEHLGRATLAKNPTLYIFMLLDLLAMQSSVAAICTLIWAQLGDPALIRSSLRVALPLLLYALLCMPLVFLFGVVTAVGHVKWLFSIICIISTTFVCWAIFILGPHVMLQGSYVPPKYAGDFLVTFMQYKGRFESFVFWILFTFDRIVLSNKKKLSNKAFSSKSS